MNEVAIVLAGAGVPFGDESATDHCLLFCLGVRYENIVANGKFPRGVGVGNESFVFVRRRLILRVSIGLFCGFGFLWWVVVVVSLGRCCH